MSQPHIYINAPLPPAHRNTDPATSAEADMLITNSGDRGSLMERCLWYVQDLSLIHI